MGHEEYLTTHGINMSDDDATKIINSLFELYELKKQNGILYQLGDEIPFNIINLYINYINKREHEIIYNDYKYKFITNESLVEPGVTKEEKEGLKNVYDYISAYPKNTPTDIFIESFKIHSKLYEKCPFPEYGSKLRSDTALLYDTPYDVLPANKASIEFNKYIGKSLLYNPTKETIDELKTKPWTKYKIYENIFDYIQDCIITCVELIKLQPFDDGNKRTFRAVLNLLLKQADIPPIYIKKEERNIYKRDLLKAICDNNYEDIIQFYYYKIADSIVGLGINKTKEENLKLLKKIPK